MKTDHSNKTPLAFLQLKHVKYTLWGIFIIGFILFVMIYQDHAVAVARQQMIEHAKAIEPDVWSYMPLNIRYLKLSAQTYNYETIVVKYLDTTLISQTKTEQEVRIKGPPPSTLMGWLIRSHLVKVYDLQTELSHDGVVIGSITAAWRCTTIYTYGMIVFCMVFMACGLWLLVKLKFSNIQLDIQNQQLSQETEERQRIERALLRTQNNLERRIHERTEALANTNAALTSEIDQHRKAQEELIQELQLNQARVNISAELMSQHYDIQKVSDVTLMYARKLTNSEHGFVSSINKKTFEMVMHAKTKPFENACHMENRTANDGYSGGLLRYPFNTQKSFYSNTPEDCLKLKDMLNGQMDFKNHMAIPVKMGDIRFGLIILANCEHDYTQKDVISVQRIAEIFALALHRQAYEADRADMEKNLLQLQKHEAIGALAGGIAHDFNNILVPILGFAELLREDVSNKPQLRESVDEILSGAKRAKELVKQILTFSRQTEEALKPLRPHLVVNEVIKLIKATIPASIEIKQKIDFNSRTIMADPTQIHQIVMNLITNSYHAMMDNGGRLTITLQNIDLDRNIAHLEIKSGPFIRLSIEDTGIGMDQNTMAKIFDPYFTSKPKGKGTGLGLSVVYGIVKNYGGDIAVKSKPGEGSKFDIYLPAFESEALIDNESFVTVDYQGDEKILLVDDEKPVLHFEQKMLERLGYQVEVTDSSMDALKKISTDPIKYDLIITDMTMPHMTGDTLALEIKKINPDLPIIICSGFSEKLTPETAAAIGVNDILIKPIVKTRLAQSIRYIFDEH